MPASPSLGTPVWLYCERTKAGLSGEPFNVLSSVAFLIAGALLLRLYRRRPPAMKGDMQVLSLILATFCIGFGSMFFHAVATIRAALVDVLPILVFVLIYVYTYGRVFLHWSRTNSAGLLAALIGINLYYKYYVFRAIDGYVSYIPTFLFLLVLTLILLVKRHPSALRFTFATLLALASLAFRTLDRRLCGLIPMGTHFIWHLLNAGLIYVLAREVMLCKWTWERPKY